MEDTSKEKTKHLFRGKGFKYFLFIIIAFFIGFGLGQYFSIKECYRIGFEIFKILNLQDELAEAISQKYGWKVFESSG